MCLRFIDKSIEIRFWPIYNEKSLYGINSYVKTEDTWTLIKDWKLSKSWHMSKNETYKNETKNN